MYVEHFASSPSTVATCLALALAAVVAAALVRRRRGLVLAVGLSLALIGGLTLAPAAGWTTFDVHDDPVAAVLSALRPQPGDLTAWTSADGPANVLLYLPLGFTLALLLRRPLLTVILSGAISLVIEAYQAATGTRIGVFADVIANTLGATIGAGLAVPLLLIVALATRRQRLDHSGDANRPGGRTLTTPAASTTRWEP